MYNLMWKKKASDLPCEAAAHIFKFLVAAVMAFSFVTFAVFFGCVKLSQNDLDNEIDYMCLTANPICRTRKINNDLRKGSHHHIVCAHVIACYT